MHIWGVATPFLHAYIIISMARDTLPWKAMVTAFCVGLVIDLFGNTPGLNAASMVAMAFARPYILELFLRREDSISLVPSVKAMSLRSYAVYVSMMLGVFLVVFFTLDILSLDNFWLWLGSIVMSIIVTLCCILAIDYTLATK